MKRVLCALFLMISLCYTSAMAESCKYAGQGSPCEPGWWVDTDSRMHCRACFYHVEEKEDMNSHVQITGWTSCTLDQGGVCTGCGWDYDPTDNEPENEMDELVMLELFYMAAFEHGSAPVSVSASGSQLRISFTDTYIAYLYDFGLPVSETMMVGTTYELTLPAGATYPATGSAVTPEVKVTASDYGPGAWLMKYDLLEIGAATYSNNTAPGTATAWVQISVKEGQVYTIKKDFTISGSAAPSLPGDSNQDGAVDLSDALAILRYVAGENVTINSVNADVNGDDTVDIHDALRIFQREAGWNVTLQ